MIPNFASLATCMKIVVELTALCCQEDFIQGRVIEFVITSFTSTFCGNCSIHVYTLLRSEFPLGIVFYDTMNTMKCNFVFVNIETS